MLLGSTTSLNMYVTKKECKVECCQFNRENASTTNPKKISKKHQKCLRNIYYASFIIFCQRFGYPNGEQEIQSTSRRWKFGMDKIYIYLIC